VYTPPLDKPKEPLFLTISLCNQAEKTIWVHTINTPWATQDWAKSLKINPPPPSEKFNLYRTYNGDAILTEDGNMGEYICLQPGECSAVTFNLNEHGWFDSLADGDEIRLSWEQNIIVQTFFPGRESNIGTPEVVNVRVSNHIYIKSTTPKYYIIPSDG